MGSMVIVAVRSYAANNLRDCDMSVTHHLRYGCITELY